MQLGFAAMAGAAVHLGHRCATRLVEYLDAGLRVHPDKAAPAKPSVAFSNDELPGLLSAVRRNLLGFLDAVTAWTAAHVPGREGEFAAALEQIIGITAPLPWAR